MYAALKAARLRKTPVGLAPFVGFSLRHIPAHLAMLRIAFIRWAGTSYTTGTLCASYFELVKKNKLMVILLIYFKLLNKIMEY